MILHGNIVFEPEIEEITVPVLAGKHDSGALVGIKKEVNQNAKVAWTESTQVMTKPGPLPYASIIVKLLESRELGDG